MKFIQNVAIVALLIATTEAHKLKQLTFNNLSTKDRDAADEVDPDDKDIDDGKISSKEDITIYTDAFVNHGENVKSINAQAAQAKQAVLDHEGLETYNNNDVSGPSPYPRPSQKKKAEKKSQMIQDAVPVKVEEKKPEPKVSLVQAEKPVSKDEIDNTNAWAHAEQTQLKEANKQQDLSTNGMSKDQKSELLHQISNSAFNELKDDADPSRIPKTED
jgi:hypothetical protein